MRKYAALTALFLSFSALPFALHAQDESVIEEEETMETVDTEKEPLSLPDAASANGKEHSAYGLETANEARDGGRGFGESRADAGRQNRSDAGREAAADARDGAGRLR